ncbi:unnamed protein product [Leptidea sinapis]|uniref:Uncharacterized protein n=1 Tax=Leptidea sinapis TaxID=189913 RepID=A0A5E4PZB4_9NEOP|nr:unnamed protein product [Leptidea sinapis]
MAKTQGRHTRATRDSHKRRHEKLEAATKVAEARDSHLWPVVDTCGRWLLLFLTLACSITLMDSDEEGTFWELHALLYAGLKHHDTNMRKSIAPAERLAITLSTSTVPLMAAASCDLCGGGGSVGVWIGRGGGGVGVWIGCGGFGFWIGRGGVGVWIGCGGGVGVWSGHGDGVGVWIGRSGDVSV